MPMPLPEQIPSPSRLTGTINLLSALPTITTALTIDGPGAASLTVNGGGSYRVLDINASTVTVQDVTIANGNAVEGGGVNNAGGTLTLRNTTFSGNHATFTGGAINNASATLTITNSTFTGNTAQYGGVIENAGLGTVTVTSSSFSSNSAEEGGAVDNFNGTLTLNNSTFSGNSATAGNGGAIANSLALTLNNTTFSGNNATVLGGGIYNTFFSNT